MPFSTSVGRLDFLRIVVRYSLVESDHETNSLRIGFFCHLIKIDQCGIGPSPPAGATNDLTPPPRRLRPHRLFLDCWPTSSIVFASTHGLTLSLITRTARKPSSCRVSPRRLELGTCLGSSLSRHEYFADKTGVDPQAVARKSLITKLFHPRSFD